jgi:Kef-type K+ transport system membrane component KefB
MEFTQIAYLLGIAALFGIVARRFKQPLLVGYLFGGLSAAYFGHLGDSEILSSMGKIGVTLLLFLIGLEMNVRDLPSIGKAAIYTGLGQIIFTFIISFLVGTFLGISTLPAAYIAIATTFSSTIIIVKLLSEKNDLDSLYGKISVGFLLVQDVVAILLLMFLAGIKRGGLEGGDYIFIVVKGVLLLLLIWTLSKKVIPMIFEKYVAGSTELLFIVSIAWALGIATLVAGPFGLSLEIGGFIAGLALSNLPENLEIASRTRPLRDFFLTIFFLTLGASLLVENVTSVILPAFIFSILVLIGHPIILLVVMGLLRFKKRTSFLASVTVAQISEFSLIIMTMGLSLGHVRESHVALTVMVAAITMTASTYLILGGDKIYLKIKDKLNIFERNITKEPELVKEEGISNHVILVGYGRAGRAIFPVLEKKKLPIIIIDYNPKIHSKLQTEKKPVIFGDISDPEILDTGKIEKARLVISTVTNLTDNLIMLEHIKRLQIKPLIFNYASLKEEAIKLYEAGSDYVIVPEIVAGEHLRHLIASHGISEKRFRRMGENNFKRLLYK